MSEPVEEYAERYSGGSMLVRNDHPEVERIFPLATWLDMTTRNGGKIYRRVITVVEDWHEVTG